jgi:hypothetical protein
MARPSSLVDIHIQSVDKTIVCDRWSGKWLNSSVGDEARLVHRFIVKIRHGHGAEALVVVHSRWLVDDYSSYYTIAVLCSEMGVIPGGAGLGSLKLVSSSGPRCYWTFGNPWDTAMTVSHFLRALCTIPGLPVVGT